MQDEESHSTDEQVKRDEQKDEVELKEQEVPTESHLTDGQIKRDEPIPVPTPPPQPAPEPPNPPQEEEEPQDPLPELPAPEEKPPVEEPASTPLVVDTPPIAPTTTPLVVDTPPIAPTTTPQVVPTPNVQDEPAISDNEYLIIDKESHITENQVERDRQPAPPQKTEPKLTPEQKAMQLTEEELDAARKLWAKNHLSQAQKKSNESRHKRMLERMDELEKLVKSGDSTLQQLSNKMNLSEKLTSSYLQKLVHAGRIKATGNTNSRRFS